MTGKHAARNRVLLAIGGLIVLAIGGALIYLAIDPAAADIWRRTSGSAVDAVSSAAGATPVAGTSMTLIDIAALVVALIAAILLITWIVAQRQRVRRTAARRDTTDVRGAITVDNRAFEQLLQARLGDEPGIIAAHTRSVPTGKNATGVRIRVTTRRGASPAVIARRVNVAADEAQEMLGQKLPVLITVRAGARAALGHVQRVS